MNESHSEDVDRLVIDLRICQRDSNSSENTNDMIAAIP